jgi:hypothetical protein
MFTVGERDRLREWLLARAEADDSVVGAAFTGLAARLAPMLAELTDTPRGECR